MEFFVYIMANYRRGTLYVGMTNDLVRRVYEHKNGLLDGFTKEYELKRLTYYETHQYVANAVQREKNLKLWKRGWKVCLIEELPPQWKDLGKTIGF